LGRIENTLRGYSMNHVQPLGNLAEDSIGTVHDGGRAESDVEAAGCGSGVLVVVSADGTLLVVQLLVDLWLEPVADAAEAWIARPGRAASLDQFDLAARVGVRLVVDGPLEDQAVEIADLCQGDEIADVVGGRVGEEGHLDWPHLSGHGRAVGQPLAVG